MILSKLIRTKFGIRYILLIFFALLSPITEADTPFINIANFDSSSVIKFPIIVADSSYHPKPRYKKKQNKKKQHKQKKNRPGWKIPKSVIDKIPSSWNSKPNQNKKGTRWFDPHNKGNGIRIDQGNKNHGYKTQQVDHVIVRKNGVVIGRDGKPLPGSIKENPVQAHIPLKEYKQWRRWDSP